MPWTFVVPVKAAAERKSRLAPALNARRRLELSEQLYRHVVRRISESHLAEQIFAMSPAHSPLPLAGGVGGGSAVSADAIVARTPSTFCITSWFQKRINRNPCFSMKSVRR